MSCILQHFKSMFQLVHVMRFVTSMEKYHYFLIFYSMISLVLLIVLTTPRYQVPRYTYTQFSVLIIQYSYSYQLYELKTYFIFKTTYLAFFLLVYLLVKLVLLIFDLLLNAFVPVFLELIFYLTTVLSKHQSIIAFIHILQTRRYTANQQSLAKPLYTLLKKNSQFTISKLDVRLLVLINLFHYIRQTIQTFVNVATFF